MEDKNTIKRREDIKVVGIVDAIDDTILEFFSILFKGKTQKGVYFKIKPILGSLHAEFPREFSQEEKELIANKEVFYLKEYSPSEGKFYYILKILNEPNKYLTFKGEIGR